LTHEKHRKYVVEARYFDHLIIMIGWALSYLRERDPEDPRLEDMTKSLKLMMQSMYTLPEE